MEDEDILLQSTDTQKRDEERYKKLLEKEKNVSRRAAAGGHLLIWALAGGPHKAWVERDVR